MNPEFAKCEPFTKIIWRGQEQYLIMLVYSRNEKIRFEKIGIKQANSYNIIIS